MSQSHSTSTTLAFPNSFMVPLSHTTRVIQATNIGFKTCSPLGARRLRWSFSIILRFLPKVSCLFSFFKSLSTQVSEAKEFQRILLLSYRFCGGLRVLIVSVWCYRNIENPMWADVVTSESALHNHLSLPSFSIQVPQNRGNNTVIWWYSRLRRMGFSSRSNSDNGPSTIPLRISEQNDALHQ